jgi:hypothetical protein
MACATAGGVPAGALGLDVMGLDGIEPEFIDEPPQPLKTAAANNSPAAEPPCSAQMACFIAAPQRRSAARLLLMGGF